MNGNAGGAWSGAEDCCSDTGVVVARCRGGRTRYRRGRATNCVEKSSVWRRNSFSSPYGGRLRRIRGRGALLCAVEVLVLLVFGPGGAAGATSTSTTSTTTTTLQVVECVDFEEWCPELERVPNGYRRYNAVGTRLCVLKWIPVPRIRV